MFDDVWNTLCMVEKNDEKLLFMSGMAKSSVYGFSSDTHELIDIYKAAEDELITSMDVIIMEDINPIFVYGVSCNDVGDGRGKILLRKNWTSTPQVMSLEHGVIDIKFSPDNEYVVCGLKNQTVLVIKQHEGVLKPSNRKPVTLEQELPISINYIDQGTSVVITTDTRKHYMMDIRNDDRCEVIDEKGIFNMSIGTLTYHNQIHMFPVVIGQELEYIVSCRGEAVEFWKNLKDLETNCGIRLHGHASKVFKVQVSHSKDLVYSLGYSDNCLIEWKVKYDLIEKPELMDQKQPQSPVHLSPMRNESFKESMMVSSVGGPKIEDDHWLKIHRELSFCLNIGEKTLDHRDSMVLFRGNREKLINALNYKEDQTFEENTFVNKRVPEVSIILNHVYGIETFSRRKTLHFLHYYSMNQNQKATDPTLTGPQAEVKDLYLPENYLKEMLFSKYTPIPYDQKHHNCERYMAYFTSRVAIVSKCTTGNLRQKFYEGHRARISCMAVHPSSNL